MVRILLVAAPNIKKRYTLSYQTISDMNIYQTLKRKLSFTTLTFLSGAVVLCLSTAATFKTSNADFKGEWKLNEQKSELGQFGARAARKIKVESLDAAAISYERTTVNQQGEEVVRKEKLTFDGKETESVVFGNSKRKATAKWSADGQSMVIDALLLFDRDGQVTEIKSKETWKLAENGQVLSIESSSSSSFGDNSMKLAYDKVK